MDTAHLLGDAIRKGIETLRQRADDGLQRLRATVEARATNPDETDAEFQTLLADFEAESDQPGDGADPDPLESKLRLANATIEELRTNLAQLQPIGDLFAEAEKARLELLEELEESRASQSRSSSNANLKRARKEIAKRDRRIATLEERADRWHTRWEERDLVASDRWRELVSLRKELRVARRSAGR